MTSQAVSSVAGVHRLIAVDPGDRYVGVAFFEHTPECQQQDQQGGDPRGGWRCTDVQELTPDEFADGLAESLVAGDLDVLVYEVFRLYGDKAKEQTGSEFETSQLIGVIKWLVRRNNEHAAAHSRAEQLGLLASCEQPGGVCNRPGSDGGSNPMWVELVGQKADIKTPTRGILRARKIKSVAKPIARKEYNGRDHVVDAELHGWRHILVSLAHPVLE